MLFWQLAIGQMKEEQNYATLDVDPAELGLPSNSPPEEIFHGWEMQ